MKRIKLIRFTRTANETFGEFTFNGIPICCSIELPWRHNARNISCIPQGVYRCTKRVANEKHVIDIYDVSDRTEIQIHIANKVSELLGCIAPGEKRGEMDRQPAVLSSSDAMWALWHCFPEEEFELEVIERF